MPRLRIDIAYDGAGFPGWQSQAGGGAIQDLVEEAIASLTGCRVRVHAAGRTDAGVHALGQVAHFDLPENRIPVERWPEALNTRLPPQIRVTGCRAVADTFHARYSATGKLYRYDLRRGRILPPHEHNRVWLVPAALDLARLREGLALFVGRHDFRAFAANRGKPERDTVREIYEARAAAGGRRISLYFKGSGFLYRMARLLTGGLVRMATGGMTLEELAALVDPPPGSESKCVWCAPACGLTLVRVFYGGRRPVRGLAGGSEGAAGPPDEKDERD